MQIFLSSRRVPGAKKDGYREYHSDGRSITPEHEEKSLGFYRNAVRFLVNRLPWP